MEDATDVDCKARVPHSGKSVTQAHFLTEGLHQVNTALS